MRRLKRRGMTAWIETTGGVFVPVKGAMRWPTALADRKKTKGKR